MLKTINIKTRQYVTAGFFAALLAVIGGVAFWSVGAARESVRLPGESSWAARRVSRPTQRARTYERVYFLMRRGTSRRPTIWLAGSRP